MWKDEKEGDVSVQDLLDFLRSAYQVNEAIEGDSVRVDWHAIAFNGLLKRLKEIEFLSTDEGSEDSNSEVKLRRCNSLDAQKTKNFQRIIFYDKSESKRQKRRNSLNSRKDSLSGVKTVEKIIRKKLNEVLQEGIFDSILPYILSRQPLNKRTRPNSGNTEGKTVEKQERDYKKDGRRKSLDCRDDRKDVEVVIHVCDELKNLKRDFKCPQSLLVSKMGYFAKVITGQRLEDMDISVHCDIAIFDWLIRWLKKEGSPTLDASIVIPILMSSAFLQMDSLEEVCLEYCKKNINEVIRESSNISCINDRVLTRLADLFTNSEIENLKDKKDKLVSKLYCKFIMYLSEPVPSEKKGHYASIAWLYRCLKCGKFITHQLSSETLCVSRQVKLNNRGDILSKHQRDPAWSLNEFIKNLKNDLKTWRKVYWRLWGICHSLRCSLCSLPFPLYHISWCQDHPESPQFFSMEHQRSITLPVGRYPCCSERAFKFEWLPSNTGCRFRDHVPDAQSQSDTTILKIFTDHRDLIRIEPGVEENGRCHTWWEGVELVPSRPRSGLLGSLIDNVIKQAEKRVSTEQKVVKNSFTNKDEASSSGTSDVESSCSGGDSEESFHAAVRITTRPKANFTAQPSLKKEVGPLWGPKLSTRCNQDNQRDLEEKALKQIEKILIKRTSGEIVGGSRSYNFNIVGGTYVRLESEWREAHCSLHGCPGSSKLRLITSSKSKSKRWISLYHIGYCPVSSQTAKGNLVPMADA